MKLNDLLLKESTATMSAAEIETWLKRRNGHPFNCTVHEDGTVDFKGIVDFRDSVIPAIPFKFNKVVGNFAISGVGLTSLHNMPNEVAGYFFCDNNEITSIEGCPSIVGDYISLENNNITSLSGIHEQVKRMSGPFYIRWNPLKSACMGIILIEGCTTFKSSNDKLDIIINKYLGKPDSLYECQTELIDAGLEEFAQL